MKLIEDIFLGLIKIAWALTIGAMKFLLKIFLPFVDWDSSTGACLIVIIIFGIIAFCNISAILLRFFVQSVS